MAGAKPTSSNERIGARLVIESEQNHSPPSSSICIKKPNNRKLKSLDPAPPKIHIRSKSGHKIGLES